MDGWRSPARDGGGVSAAIDIRQADGAMRWSCRWCIAEYGETIDNCGPWGPDVTNDPGGHHQRMLDGEREHNLRWHTPAILRGATP